MMVALAPCNGNRDKNKTQRVYTGRTEGGEDDPPVNEHDTPSTEHGEVQSLVDERDMAQLMKDSEADYELAKNVLLGNTWAKDNNEIRIIDETGSEVTFDGGKYRKAFQLTSVEAPTSGDDLYLVISNSKTIEAINKKMESNLPEDGCLMEDQRNANLGNGKHLRVAYKFVFNPKQNIKFTDDSKVFQATWMVKANLKLYLGVRTVLEKSTKAHDLVSAAHSKNRFENVAFIAHMGFCVTSPQWCPGDAKGKLINAWVKWLPKLSERGLMMSGTEWNEMVNDVETDYASVKTNNVGGPDKINPDMFTRDKDFMEKYSVD
jgi:hypothetical protein